MAPPTTLEISIPTTTTSNDPNTTPHTLYNITLRLPLRSFTISKRYSDFTTFHAALLAQTNTAPPAPLPPKSWFANTLSNATLREERRQGLERYLQAINESSDGRWRGSSAWRGFLNLPSAGGRAGTSTTSRSGSSGSGTASKLHAAMTDPAARGGEAITDSTLWLDCFRDLKAHLHDARLHLTRRDQETTPAKQHESSALTKSALVRAGSLVGALEGGLRNLGGDNAGKDDGLRLGEGELRRRKDLLVNARKEKDGLEDLLNAMAAKGRLDNAVASAQDKEPLFGNTPNTSSSNGSANGHARKPGSGSGGRGRVLGKETERTRELDNQGVLQLQRETMEEQDLGLEELRKIVARQRELGVAINGELQVQNELLMLADEDADRLQRKVDVGKKRLGKIS